MNVNILTQAIRHRRYKNSTSLRMYKLDEGKSDEKHVYKDVAGFIIFFVVAFSLFTIVMFG
jgi:hypothetical protein